MGVCSSSGGMFNNSANVQGVDHIVPVDVYLPSCWRRAAPPAGADMTRSRIRSWARTGTSRSPTSNRSNCGPSRWQRTTANRTAWLRVFPEFRALVCWHRARRFHRMPMPLPRTDSGTGRAAWMTRARGTARFALVFWMPAGGGEKWWLETRSPSRCRYRGLVEGCEQCAAGGT
jgi:hypothetical protein